MPENKKTTQIAYIKLVAAIAIWGGSFIATKIAVQDVSPVTVVWLRFLIGTTVLGYVAWKQNDISLPGWKDSLELIWLGFLGITLHQWLQSSGLVTSEASTTAWIVSTTPVFMALLGWAFLKEKLTRETIIGILLASIGVLLVVSKGNIKSVFSGNFGSAGDVLILISAPNWAIYSVLSYPILRRLSSTKVTLYVFLSGWLLTSIQFLGGKHWVEFSRLTPGGWLSIAFLGIFCSSVAYIFYNDGMKALPTSQVGIFLYLEPLVATIVAAIILSEKIFLASLVGGGLILIGVWIVNRKSVQT
jgi:drug/metabolite transporter (DMT)-like permease